jgi:hypothetical protein
MPKAILRFNLPDEEEEWRMTLNARKYYLALWDLSQKLRSKLKYEELTEEEYKIYDQVRDMFWECLRENDVDEDL